MFRIYSLLFLVIVTQSSYGRPKIDFFQPRPIQIPRAVLQEWAVVCGIDKIIVVDFGGREALRFDQNLPVGHIVGPCGKDMSLFMTKERRNGAVVQAADV